MFIQIISHSKHIVNTGRNKKAERLHTAPLPCIDIPAGYLSFFPSEVVATAAMSSAVS